MCESCRKAPAITALDLGQDVPPFRVCAPCAVDAIEGRVLRLTEFKFTPPRATDVAQMSLYARGVTDGD